jgi:phospholipid-translocating ATPase
MSERLSSLSSRVRSVQQNRDEEIRGLFERFESGQTLIGCTGIEDRFQDGVPQTIEMLCEAGIRFWMVTGDLMNTTIKIARSSRLIADDGPLFNITNSDAGAADILHSLRCWIRANPDGPFYLVLDGSTTVVEEYLGCFSRRSGT